MKLIFKSSAKILFCICIVYVMVKCNAVKPPPIDEETSYWHNVAQQALKKALKSEKNTNVAKNVIFFLGDGMGIPSITAGRIYKGQKSGKTGEEANLEWDRFNNVALIKTYNVDKQVPDSAGTATAFLSGVKTNEQILGLNSKASLGECSTAKGAEISSIADWFIQENKSTGVVTTARITHASPGALYAHTPHRDWESDNEIPKDQRACKDIARQLIEDEPGRNLKVIFGGGRRHFFPNTTMDQLRKKKNYRTDNKDLVEAWKKDKIDRGMDYSYVINTRELNAVDLKKTEFVLGLFDHSHMSYELNRNKNSFGQPSLSEMTEKAIDLLSKDPNGYFLFVEGARIDHAHHDNLAYHALEETYQLDRAVEVALKKTNSDDTLIVVTADHDHSMKMNGKQPRGSDILGVAENSITDGLPYTTLLYTTGPGYKINAEEARKNLTSFKKDKDYLYLSAVPRNWSAHGGEDVSVYADGPMSHLFQGVQEQNYIAHVMAYASCVGQNKDHCKSGSATFVNFTYWVTFGKVKIFTSYFTVVLVYFIQNSAIV